MSPAMSVGRATCQYGVQRRRGPLRGRIAARAIGWAMCWIACAAQAAAQPAPASDQLGAFAALLRDAEVALPGADWEALAEGTQLSLPAVRTLDQILFRLAQLDEPTLRAWELSWPTVGGGAAVIPSPGSLLRVDGVVDAFVAMDAPADQRDPAAPTRYGRCRLRAGGRTLDVWTARWPAAWDRDATAALNAQVSCRAVALAAFAEDAHATVGAAATDWLEWREPTGLPAAATWLAARGVDAALWGEVRHRRPFVDARESREGDAFYAILAAFQGVAPSETWALARQTLEAALPRLDAERRAAQQEQRAVREALERERTPDLRQQYDAARRAAGLAAEQLRVAQQGRSSVAPLFLTPAAATGEWVTIEGVARRAVRIAIDVPRRARTAALVGRPVAAIADHYYEIEVYPNDSQNLPVVCCAAALPADFPTGDLVRQPVRLGGVFFKSWSYRRRSAPPDDADQPPVRLYAPIVVTAGPLTVAPPPTGGAWGWIGGVAFLGVLAGIWALLAAFARRDRLARARRTSYDGPFDAAASATPPESSGGAAGSASSAPSAPGSESLDV